MSAAPKFDIQQRRVPRRAYEGTVGVLAGGGYELEAGLTVGEGGMSFTTSRALQPGDQVVVNFTLEGSLNLIIVRATVRNFTPAKTTPRGREEAFVGVEFKELGFAHRREIRNFVASATQSML